MNTKLNWFGFAGGASTFLLVAVSLFVPWWQLTVGDSLFTAYASPVNTNFNFFGNSFVIPLIWAFNIASIISLVAGGAAILVYSLNPSKSYAKKLLDFAYKKPLIALIIFVVGLFLTTLLVKGLLGLDVPLIGSTDSNLSGVLVQGGLQGVSIRVSLIAGFLWPFALAASAAVLCIAAKFYHNKILDTSR